MKFALFVIVTYLLGSINPSIIQGRLKGIDIKKEGSGNAGTTNTLRVMGKEAALVSLVCDVLKGVISVLLGGLAGPYCAYACALSCFCGHIWPAYYHFKGGKGVATCFGTVLAVNWKLALICLSAVVVIVLITKMVSAGSIIGAAVLPAVSLMMEPLFVPFAAAMAVIIIVKHRSNIDRIVNGKESKLSFGKNKKGKKAGK